MSLNDAFKKILAYQSRPMTYYDTDNDVEYTNVQIAVSNYSRNLANLESTVSKGREFVISKDQISILPKRGDKITDPDFGTATVKEVREMVLIGIIAGYRLRTD